MHVYPTSSSQEYLEGFQYTVKVMQSASALERVSYEFGVDNYSEGVRYFEVRFAPQLHAHVLSGLTMEQVTNLPTIALFAILRNCIRVIGYYICKQWAFAGTRRVQRATRGETKRLAVQRADGAAIRVRHHRLCHATILSGNEQIL